MLAMIALLGTERRRPRQGIRTSIHDPLQNGPEWQCNIRGRAYHVFVAWNSDS
jgi:hypothetical protein